MTSAEIPTSGRPAVNVERVLKMVKRDLDGAWSASSDGSRIYLLMCCVENLWRAVSALAELEERRGA